MYLKHLQILEDQVPHPLDLGQKLLLLTQLERDSTSPPNHRNSEENKVSSKIYEPLTNINSKIEEDDEEFIDPFKKN